MSNHNKRIVFVNENRITLLDDLIPKDVTMFEYERKEDGRIVLTPFSKVSSLSSDAKYIGHKQNGLQKPGKVIDFQSAKANRKHRFGKKKLKIGK